MGRLRQIQPGRYGSSDAVGTEFENIIRYLNAAELGNNTLGELLSKLFNEGGEVTLGLGFRFDPAQGLQVSFSDGEWFTIAASDSIRGTPGVNVGTIDAPMFSNRQDFVPTDGQTQFPYRAATGSVEVHVYVNGLLQPTSSYAYDSALERLTLSTPRSANDIVTAVSVRTNAALTYRRQDNTATAGQVVFSFPHTENEVVYVYRGGLLQRVGVGNDYTNSPASSTVTMSTGQSSGTVITIMAVNNTAVREVAGIMLEDRYTTNGNIRLDRVSIPLGSIPQDRIANLILSLSSKADLYIGTGEPAGTIRQGSLWINTSRTVPSLNFYFGASWFDASPNGLIPAISQANAAKFLRLNQAASALEFVDLDLSSRVARTAIGAQNGVCPLDANTRVPNQFLPDAAFKAPIIGAKFGAVADGNLTVGIISGARHIFDGMTLSLGQGTATVRLTVGGVDIGNPTAIGSSATKINFNPVTRDAIQAGQSVVLAVTSAVSASDLAFNISTSILA